MTHVNSSGPSRAPKSTCTLFAALGVSITPSSSAEYSGPAYKKNTAHSRVEAKFNYPVACIPFVALDVLSSPPAAYLKTLDLHRCDVAQPTSMT
jgi:hypothetical protein